MQKGLAQLQGFIYLSIVIVSKIFFFFFFLKKISNQHWDS